VRIAYVEPVGGVAGDMLLGALIGAGLELSDLVETLARLGLDGYRLSVARVEKLGIPAHKITVELERHADHATSHRGAADGPTLMEVDVRLATALLPAGVSESASRVFRCLALATARVEGVAVDALRFDARDVIDTFVDVVGVSYALHALGIERLYAAPLPLVESSIETRHGTLRLPHPVTREIVSMAAVPSRSQGEGGEQVTPTGAAILATLADFDLPDMRVQRRGVGAGDADLAVPNVVRVQVGELVEADDE
jgi:pyridinium-3,5-bisthiocarboxylic acid mononucleotide nickel chelatase